VFFCFLQSFRCFGGLQFACHSIVRKMRSGGIDDANATVTFNDTPVRWCAIDPDAELLRRTTVHQPEYMVSLQITQAHTIHGQCDALRTIQSHPGNRAPHRELIFAMQNTLYHWRVRARAAEVLAALSHNAGRAENSLLLLDFVRTLYFAPPQYQHLKANDFAAPGGIEGYFLLQSLVGSIANLRDEDGYTPDAAISMLLTIVQEQDNSRNRYSNAALVASTVRALGRCRWAHGDRSLAGMNRYPLRSTRAPAESSSAVNVPADSWDARVDYLLRRLMMLDKINPSVGNAITCAALDAFADLLINQCAVTAIDFVDFAAPFTDNKLVRSSAPHAFAVRQCAFGCLVRLGARRPDLYLCALDCLAAEPSAGGRRRLSLVLYFGS
jgi:hypothetical protein